MLFDKTVLTPDIDGFNRIAWSNKVLFWVIRTIPVPDSLCLSIVSRFTKASETYNSIIVEITTIKIIITISLLVIILLLKNQILFEKKTKKNILGVGMDIELQKVGRQCLAHNELRRVASRISFQNLYSYTYSYMLQSIFNCSLYGLWIHVIQWFWV